MKAQLFATLFAAALCAALSGCGKIDREFEEKRVAREEAKAALDLKLDRVNGHKVIGVHRKQEGRVVFVFDNGDIVTCFPYE